MSEVIGPPTGWVGVRRRPDETAAPPAVLTNFGEWLARVDADQADGPVFDAQVEVWQVERSRGPGVAYP